MGFLRKVSREEMLQEVGVPRAACVPSQASASLRPEVVFHLQRK